MIDHSQMEDRNAFLLSIRVKIQVGENLPGVSSEETDVNRSHAEN